jgi:D-beta-D-heptose 7-phosphate kinase/D-beta-D-heptose 1-phosphate adenosyltransferase
MSTNALTSLADAFAGLDMLVVGDVMLDSYLEGTAGRFCQEAPVPAFALTGREDAPGGAANTAATAAALGGRVSLLSAVGTDHEGDVLRQVLAGRGVSGEHLLACPGRRTLAKQRVFAAGQMLLRLDQGTTGPADAATEVVLLARLEELFPRAGVVVLSDYGYGVLTPRMIVGLARLQAAAPRVIVADSRRLAAFRDVGVTAVKPNYQEALHLLEEEEVGGHRTRAEAVALFGDKILDRTGARIAAVTLDSEGALIFERGRPVYRTYAGTARPGCVAGAGDTFAAALALALAVGADTASAAELASAAAAVVVGKDRTAAFSAAELREQVSACGKFLSDRARLAECLEAHRRRGRRIVFTNGCFDILHCGHITYLTRAKALGDVLVVGLNADESIRRLKGLSRPINTLEDRIQVLAALSCVDHVVAFDEDLPNNLIRVVRPDVFVKGGDYTRDRLPEAALVEELGGRVQILPFLQDRSTSGLIERIQGLHARPQPVSGAAT